MFDIGWSEILVIAVVAIVVVGPKDLPPMLRAFGRTVSKMRKMAGEFQGQFNEALREAELDDVKKSFDELRGLNPLNDIRRSLDPMAGPIARPAPAPLPPPIDQPAQPETALDLELSESLPAAIAAEAAAKPKRVRKPKAETADTVPAIKKPAARKPRAAAKSVDVAADAADVAPVRKPRATKPKAAPKPDAVAIEPAAEASSEAPLPVEPAPTVEGPTLVVAENSTVKTPDETTP